jgi:hypothetical protein
LIFSYRERITNTKIAEDILHGLSVEEVSAAGAAGEAVVLADSEGAHLVVEALRVRGSIIYDYGRKSLTANL